MSNDEITELSRSLEFDEGGIKILRGKKAWEERVLNWLETSEGDVLDEPGWGNNLAKYQFATINDDLLAFMEMDVISKIESDVEDIVITSIKIEEVEIDLLLLRIICNGELSELNFSIGDYF